MKKKNTKMSSFTDLKLEVEHELCVLDADWRRWPMVSTWCMHLYLPAARFSA
jgi:hypothetical protein